MARSFQFDVDEVVEKLNRILEMELVALPCRHQQNNRSFVQKSSGHVRFSPSRMKPTKGTRRAIEFKAMPEWSDGASSRRYRQRQVLRLAVEAANGSPKKQPSQLVLAQAQSGGLEVPNVPRVLGYRPVARKLVDARDV